ncbi:MAG: ABC transporter permease [Deltaproteobacteria bacterium]|nr:MAG: ABC transporter permease [Deltaproteobacteria bacterium]
MKALIKKELKIIFASPIFAIVSALFLFLTGFAFTASMTQLTPQKLPEASVRGIVYFMAVILLFISPFLTMRSFAEERKAGTLEFLRTSPLSDLDLVLGKFLGVLSLLILILILTLEFPIFIFMMGKPDVGVMILSYAGLFLLGASFFSYGHFLFGSVQKSNGRSDIEFCF